MQQCRRESLYWLNGAAFLQAQFFLLPELLLFYQYNGLSVGDFFLFQGIFSLAGLLFELPLGYLGDIFPKKNILILSYSFFILRLFLWFFFAKYGFWIILSGEILYAAQKASFSGVSDSYIYEYLKKMHRESKMLFYFGRLNFFISVGAAFSALVGPYLYQEISQWTQLYYHQNLGFSVLLGLELLLNLIALGLLLKLPSIPPCLPENNLSLRSVYSNFFHIIRRSMQEESLRYHLIFTGLLAATTVVFVWSFQPMMELMALPVAIYGFIFFVNHILRAFSSLKLNSIMHCFSLNQWGLTIFTLFLLGFVLSVTIIWIQPLSLTINLLLFLFLAGGIGLQWAFTLANIERIHRIVSPAMRSTVSSLSSAFGRLGAGLFMILLKFLVDKVSLPVSLGVCGIIFLFGIFPLYKMWHLPDSCR